MVIVQRDCILRQRHQPDRKLDRVAGETARQTFAVPALVDLTEIFPDLLRQADPFGNSLRHLAVTGQDRDVYLRALGKAAFHRLGEFLGRRTGKFSCDRADKDFDEFRTVAHVDMMQFPPQRDLVAPRVGQQMSVGIASDVAEQSLMEDAPASFLVESGDLCVPHRQNAGAKCKITRMAGRKVGRIGESHQKVRAPNRRYRHEGSP